MGNSYMTSGIGATDFMNNNLTAREAPKLDKLDIAEE